MTATEARVQLWSCGGGRQSAGIAALIVQGRLPRPGHVVMVAIRGEKRTTWEYVTKYIRPAMHGLGIPFTIVPSVKYATKGFWGGKDRDDILLPMHTNQSGEASKLDEFCSGEWKREVAKRWASQQCGWFDRGVDCWIGISWDEKHRRRAPRAKWYAPVYPLLDWLTMHISGCEMAVEKQGWPAAPRSRCVFCPNQSDAEWLELTPDEFERACQVEDEVHTKDPHAFMHKSMVPLRMATLDPNDNGRTGGCSSGMCF